ncbi:8-amino-7-oxononanoate synthase [biofilm metagenome]
MFDLSHKLNELARQDLYRTRRIIESPQGINLICNGKPVINFCSNDYLGLANHPTLIETYKSALDQWGVGSGSAHLVCGHTSAHHALEEELAAFTGRERALLFSTGYMANMGAISALVGRGDTVLEDRLNHASLIDGGLLSGAKLKRYGHLDVEHLSSMLISTKQIKVAVLNEDLDAFALRQAQNERIRALIVTDGVFSMDGDIAPLPELAALANEHDAWLMVDDAHGLGVLGEQGKGTLSQLGLGQDDVQVLIGTFGKAFGTFGAFVAGSDALIETLVQSARTFIYTTAMPAALAEATRISLRIIQAESWRRDKLTELIGHFRKGAEQLGLSLMPSATPIQPVLIGDSKQAVVISEALFALGFLVSAIRPPTVPQGSARLRISLSASHELEHIDRLLDSLGQVCK